MAEEKKALNLLQRLAKIRAICDAVEKSLKGYGYSYADITDILAKVRAGMEKYDVSLIPMIVRESARVEPVSTVNTKFDKTGKSYDATNTEMMFTANMEFKWVCNDNPNDFIIVPWFVTGSQSDPSQAMGSGLTYTERQFLTMFFQIAQGNDVDAYRSKQKEAAESENRAVSEAIIAEFDTKLKSYLGEHEDKKDEVKKFIVTFAGKSANYLAIKDPEVAASMLKNFEEKYINGGK